MYGELTEHAVGTLMKEAVRRAIVAIRAERFSFEVSIKGKRASGSDNVVTTADRAAQAVFVKLLRDWFPGYGIVAEEDQLSVPGTLDADLFFTVDPLDGTSAFVRRQSHGIGTMLALVCEGRVIGACVGDVMTQEIYSWRPGDPRVWRISEYGNAEELKIPDDRALDEQWILLRERPEELGALAGELVRTGQGLFRGYEILAGSIGIAFARLWKGEVGGALVQPDAATPWDLAPVLGISQALGFVFLQQHDHQWRPWEPTLSHTPTPVDTEILCVHRSRLEELQSWCNRARGESPG